MHPYKIIESGQPIDKAEKALLLLHGRGASAYDILSLSQYFVDDTFYVAAPEAKNGTWYPNSFMAEESQNEPWLSSAVDLVRNLIDITSKMIPLNQIYLMGFSQGACLALETASRHAEKYGGVVAFTGGLIGKTINIKKYQGNFFGAPVFIGNSDVDPHVPLSRTEESAAVLKSLGANVSAKIYPGMAHTINEDEIETVQRIIFSR